MGALTEDLPVLTGEPRKLPGTLAYLGTAPGVMRITSYCDGTIKATLTAGTPIAAKRAAHLQLLRTRYEAPGELERAKGRERERYMDRGFQEGSLTYAAPFNSSEKFRELFQPISGRGRLPRRKRFSARARRSICEGAAIAHERFQMNGVFLTWTIPGSGELIEKTVAEVSGDIMQRVNTWVRDNIEGERGVFGVWEHQKRGMLHLHLCVMADDREGLAKLRAKAKLYWAGLLKRLCDEYGVNLCQADETKSWLPEGDNSQQYADWIHTNVAKYLSKYTSKAYREDASRSKYHPSRWWTQSRWLAEEARARRSRIIIRGCTVAELCAQMEKLGQSVEDMAEYFKQFSNPAPQALPGFLAYCDKGQGGDVFRVVVAQLVLDEFGILEIVENAKA